MRIRMYNVGFGDCFCLRDKKENFLIDFGTSNHRIGGRRRRDIFDMIIADLSTLQNKNLLLTNFHPDHLSGLLYLMKYRGGSYDFGKIYLPDVFSSPDKSRTLALLLMADLLKDSWLPSHQVSLYALAESFCRKPQKLRLLSRGECFEKKYVALWPDMDFLSKETEKIMDVLWREHSGILQKLISYAEKIRIMICSMVEEDGPVSSGAPVFPITDLEQEFRELRGMGEFRLLMQDAEKEENLFRDLKQKLSIVFQNIEDDEWNLLFTGDARPDVLQMIADNYDQNIPLHEHYWCIKVPHHGTASHYFDFSPYTPENMLISSGMYHTTSKRKAKAARITPQYAGLFHTWDVNMWCSESKCCDGCQDGCSCRECEIISPRYYLDIR